MIRSKKDVKVILKDDRGASRKCRTASPFLLPKMDQCPLQCTLCKREVIKKAVNDLSLTVREFDLLLSWLPLRYCGGRKPFDCCEIRLTWNLMVKSRRDLTWWAMDTKECKICVYVCLLEPCQTVIIIYISARMQATSAFLNAHLSCSCWHQTKM